MGMSHSCKLPQGVRELPIMTSTRVPVEKCSKTIDTFVRERLQNFDALYDLELDRLRSIQPDFIVSQTLCDVCAVSTGDVMNALHSLPSKPKLIDLTPNNLEDVFDDIVRVGEELGVAKAARRLVKNLRGRLSTIALRTEGIPEDTRPRVAFLEWLYPPFNGGHWNPELIQLAGGIDILNAPGKPSSTLSWDEIANSRPEVLFIACCGFGIDRALEDIQEISKTAHWRCLPAVQNNRVYVADGHTYFSCPGPRLIDSLEILAHALHPQVHSQPAYDCTRAI